jgi:stearoyl-CoA desaturase (delta-9 desaturase)
MEYALAMCGVCTFQDSPARWVAIHRMHHQSSDRRDDPHTPRAGFWWSHVGWLLVRNRRHDQPANFERYARDLLRDPFYMKLEKRLLWARIYFLHAAAIMGIGFVWGWMTTGAVGGAVQHMASWLVWGVAVRTVVTLHITWSVNSVTHLWGYRNYETRDDSRNNWAVALLAFGEGWHNNHHAYQRSARHGHRWWELDASWLVIRLWELLGLVDNVVRPDGRPAARAP